MKQVLKVIAIIGLPVLLFCIYAFNFPGPGKKSPPISADHPKIQVAILLDVSNSMDGLIGQAKAQLWNMVGVLGKAKCNNAQPQIEIALYEYGRETNDPNNGYVKQISPFTSDLDKLSQQLFSLTTNGGDEYCGHVIFNSINELSWDPSPTSYKVIFISGNEDFLQGDVVYTRACDAAKKKGVIVNTIYCGDRMQGIQEHWNLNAECGNGSFSTINQDVKLEEIPTPYDSTIIALNDKLNKTYMSYGYDQMLAGKGSGMLMQIVADSLNLSMNKSVAIQRAGIKSNAKLYNNSTWDMVSVSLNLYHVYIILLGWDKTIVMGIF